MGEGFGAVVLYITLFLIILVVTFLQFFSKKVTTFWFILFGIVLTSISMFRYGSGTDYFGYMMHYSLNPETIMDSIKYPSHMDMGYRVSAGIFKGFHLSFDIFIMSTSFVVMFIFLKVIKENSKFKLLSLLIFYAVYYSIYVNSAIRQGIAMAIFFLAFYKFFKEGKTFKYLLLIILASLFHSSAVIMLLIPAIKYIHKNTFSNKILNVFLILASLFLCLSGFSNTIISLVNISGTGASYEVTSFNPMALALRAISVAFILLLYKSNKRDSINEFDKLQIYVYFIGSVLFISVANMEILSRILEYFTLLEVILIPNLIKGIRFKTTKIASFAFIIMLIGTLFIKDIGSFIDQGNYYETNITDYKYVTIFNKDDIYKYRIVTVPDDSY